MAKTKRKTGSQSVLVRKAARHIRLVGFVDYRRYLANVYHWVKQNAESYSYIQFSVDIGLGKSNASRLIIKGERNISDKHAHNISERIGLTGSAYSYLVALVRYSNARSIGSRDEILQELMVLKNKIEPESIPSTQIEYYGSWINPVIRQYAGLPGFDGSPEWIQDRLQFPMRLDGIKRSLELLEKMGFLIFDKKSGRYEKRQTTVPRQQVDDLAAIRYHQSMIEAGKESLTRIPGDQRFVSGCTAVLDHAAYQEICQHIDALVDKVEAREQNCVQDQTEVYQVNVQFFPFTGRK